ncbi:MAG: hypothetical protein CFE21_18670 [Bacteroidetes bacterium B1(2017)]|nr:MAG: hypothetical protein CFE21_18670 [Bacteroidetes bacterium B1(2017)]
MDKLEPKYQRARVFMLRDILSKVDPKAQHAALMRSGVFPPDRDEKAMVTVYLRDREFPTEPLSFTEQCTFNTWFSMHPEKVCGTEKLSTSREFPVTIEGDRKWIESTLAHALGDGQLILDLPGQWYIEYFDPSEDDFDVTYRFADFHITVYTHGADYNLQIHKGDFILDNINYRLIQDANKHILDFMQAHLKPHNPESILEMEALALEIEFQLKQL